MTDLPSYASVVVIGGGVMGLSTAYHLAAPGCGTWSCSSGTSWARAPRARPPAGYAPSSPTRSTSSSGHRSLRRSRPFGEDFGQEIDLHQVGYLFLLDRRSTWRPSRQNVALQNELGVPSRMIDVAEAQRSRR